MYDDMGDEEKKIREAKQSAPQDWAQKKSPSIERLLTVRGAKRS